VETLQREEPALYFLASESDLYPCFCVPCISLQCQCTCFCVLSRKVGLVLSCVLSWPCTSSQTTLTCILASTRLPFLALSLAVCGCALLCAVHTLAQPLIHILLPRASCFVFPPPSPRDCPSHRASTFLVSLSLGLHIHWTKLSLRACNLNNFHGFVTVLRPSSRVLKC
jgi:hypothetical protein